MQQLKYKSSGRILKFLVTFILVLSCVGIVDAQSGTQATVGQDRQDAGLSLGRALKLPL